MRIMILGLVLVAVVSLSMWAQQPAGRGQRQGQAAAAPLQGGQMAAADLAAIVAKQPKETQAPGGLPIYDWLECQVLRLQAEKLFNSKK